MVYSNPDEACRPFNSVALKRKAGISEWKGIYTANFVLKMGLEPEKILFDQEVFGFFGF